MDKALAIQKEVQKILGTEQVYLVGGSVRDIVMNHEAKDYDFTTVLLPDQITERVKAAGRRVYTIGEKFGTIGFKVPVSDGYEVVEDINIVGKEKPDYKELINYEYVEVTTFRSEVYTSKSRKPEVKFVPSLDEDLARRDFTMNAMVLRSDGSIYDPYGGKLDIYSKQIKTVGMPKDRIQEDPLRMLRAARFAARYDFKIDPNFIGKARHLADRIYDVSIERWVQELDKLLISSYRNVGILELEKMGVLVRILPEVATVMDAYPNFEGVEFFYSDKKYTEDEAWKHLLGWTGLPYTDNDATMNGITRYINSGICARLKFSNDRTNFILDKQKKKE